MGSSVSGKEKQLGPLSMIFISVLIGVIAGLGAVVFRELIALFHNLLFLGKLSATYDANIHTPPSPLGWLIIFIPVAGAAGVTFLVENFAPETRGHGVPEVMDAIYYNKGIIRPVVALIKSLASALSIGSGGSIGREGPIIQIGSAFGSVLGQLLRVPVWQRITMIAAGAGGGIAATFNTPVGGVLFAQELLLHEISVKTLLPVAISTATATYMGQIFFGPSPSFVIPAFERPFFSLTRPEVLIAYMGLGIIMGAASALYIRSIYAFEDFFGKIVPNNGYVRHMSGMLLSGIAMYLLLVTTGHYYIEGVGYSTIQDILTGTYMPLYLLLILFILKLFATSLALGSGASGGIFSPALFMGATLGGTYGFLLSDVFPGLKISPIAFAVAGMGGMVGGATGATIASIIMILEMTYDYSVVIPMTLTVAFSYSIRWKLSRDSIYTLKLARRGHYMPEAFLTNVSSVKRARDLMETAFVAVPAATPLYELAHLITPNSDVRFVIAEAAGKVAGIVGKDALEGVLRHAGGTEPVSEFVATRYTVVQGELPLFEVMDSMQSDEAALALVVKGEGAVAKNIVGVISRHRIVDIMAQTADLFSRG